MVRLERAQHAADRAAAIDHRVAGSPCASIRAGRGASGLSSGRASTAIGAAVSAWTSAWISQKPKCPVNSSTPLALRVGLDRPDPRPRTRRSASMLARGIVLNFSSDDQQPAEVREHLARDRGALGLGSERKRRLEVLHRQPPVPAIEPVEGAAEQRPGAEDSWHRQHPGGGDHAHHRDVLEPVPERRARRCGVCASSHLLVKHAKLGVPDSTRAALDQGSRRARGHAPASQRRKSAIGSGSIVSGTHPTGTANGRSGSSRTKSFSVVSTAAAPVALARAQIRRTSAARKRMMILESDGLRD